MHSWLGDLTPFRAPLQRHNFRRPPSAPHSPAAAAASAALSSSRQNVSNSDNGGSGSGIHDDKTAKLDNESF